MSNQFSPLIRIFIVKNSSFKKTKTKIVNANKESQKTDPDFLELN